MLAGDPQAMLDRELPPAEQRSGEPRRGLHQSRLPDEHRLAPHERGGFAVRPGGIAVVSAPQSGIASGQRLRLMGEGEAGAQGGPPGDLYVVIEVEEHPFFQRDGNDLACQIPVNFTTLALGGEIQVPTVGGGTEPLKIPEGTATGSLFRLRGKGMPDVSGRGRGDLLVTVQAITPRKLTREQRKLLEQLAEVLPPQEF